MNAPPPTTLQKALSINLDPLKYGTIVEIGAGQEVARWFFQAGAAAGTVAKTMSAYDMTVSDEIYGATPGGRYVSRARLERMLEREFNLVISRIRERRPEDSTFFAFADTVAAQGFRKRDECHGWLGIRFQSTPGAAPDQIVLHVRLLDDTNLEQQEALGILGVNLIHGAFHLRNAPEKLLHGLTDNLKWGRVEIDLVEFSGPALGCLDNRLMALELVKASLARAVLFDDAGRVQIPADAFYKRSVVGLRGNFRPVTDTQVAMYENARGRFAAEDGIEADRIVGIAEMTMAELVPPDAAAVLTQEADDEEDTPGGGRAAVGEIDTADFLARVDMLTGRGFHVLISEFFRHFRVRQFLSRYTSEPVAFATDVDNFADILRTEFYDGLDGGIMEGLGKLFLPKTAFYIYLGRTGTAFDEMEVADEVRPLLAYLMGRGQVVAV
ncbi:MAG: TonB-dependent receptor [Alphaproteobacteria bacterium]